MRVVYSAKVGAAALAGLLSAGGLFLGQRGEPPAPLGAGTPVIVELFSSEGCSSCPPADQYAAALDRSQPIDGASLLVLEEHVDYWDRLGWKDPFGKPDFGARQQAYARVLGDHRVYTPEIVIDGHLVMEGGDEDQGRRMMQASAREPKAKISIARGAARLTVDVAGVPAAQGDDVAEVWLAITESGLSTNVEHGENAGRRLAHAPVVRSLRPLGVVSGAPFHAEVAIDAESGWKPGALRSVVFVQLRSSRKIVGAAGV